MPAITVTNYLKPPPSASPEQVTLWNRVLKRRQNQLRHFHRKHLQAVLDQTGGGDVGGPSSEAEKDGDGQKALRSSIERILTQHFHRSVDSSVSPSLRTESLRSLRNLLEGIDAQHAKVVGERIERRKEYLKNKKKDDGGEEKGGDHVLEVEAASADRSTNRAAKDIAASEAGGGQTNFARGTAPDTSSSVQPAPPAQSQQAPPARSGGGGGGEGDRAPPQAASSKPASNPPASSEKKFSQPPAATAAMGLPLSRPSAPAGPTKALASRPPSSPEIVEIPATPPPSPPPEAAATSESGASSAALSDVDDVEKAEAADSTQRDEQLKKRAARKPRPPPRTVPRSLTFLPDNTTPCLSASLTTRPACKITYDAGDDPLAGSDLDETQLDDVTERLNKWDPYWEVVTECTRRTDEDYYEHGLGTGKVLKCDRMSHGEAPLTATDCIVTLPPDSASSLGGNGQKIQWGRARPAAMQKTYRDGERRLIMRMIPLTRTEYEKKKRADTHQWPKGTFLQVRGRPTALGQRKQQSHDHKLWKGMSMPLDLTPVISNATWQNKLELMTRDSERYGIQIALCDYVSPESLYKKVLKKGVVRDMSHDEGLGVALEHVNHSTVMLADSSDDEEDAVHTNSGENSLTFSLKCPISMNIMETPVRGSKCRHMQCFDLKTYLQSNATVSGGRWRCGVCEDFVAPADLVRDGLVVRMLKRYKGIANPNRDKISFKSNADWALMEENRLRYSGKKRGPPENNGGTGADARKAKVTGNDGGDGGGKKDQQEIIIL